MARCIRALVVVAVTLTALAIVGSASAQKYIVVLKTGQSQPGIKAINIAGGKIVGVNKLGIATVTSSKPSFAQKLRVSGAVAGVARDAWFGGRPASPVFLPKRVAVSSIGTEQAACSALYSVPATLGPDPLGACQWDMSAAKAIRTSS